MDQKKYGKSPNAFSLFDPPGMTFIVVGALAISWAMGELGSPMGQLLLIPFGLAMIIVPIFTMRALGQVALSWLAGGTILRFTSGFLKLQRTPEGLKLQFNNVWKRYPGGAVLAPGEGADLRKWVAAREFGSFVGLLVYVILIMTIIPQVQSLPAVRGNVEIQQLLGTTLFALAVLVVTLGVWQLINRQLPRIWRMWRRGARAEREAAIISMTSYMVAGYRPSEWPSQWTETAMHDEDESLEGLYGYRFGYLQAVDQGEFTEAERYFTYLENNIERLPPKLQDELIHLERPFVEAWMRTNPKNARKLLDELDSRIGKRYRYRRVQAAVLLAENELQQARELATEGINAAILAGSDDGEVLAEIALLETILRQAGGDPAEAEEPATAATG